ncbi:InlB B-repeat-containing protein [Butyrivibrio sp. AE3004]|uniref:InlB B-repeat-containing protein n=1 Tax=Butyrivibrio sp. AE3004 TaxID=1506994 RepID=UPI000494BF40|nr:InlB B-repeat-containing protein [Butyrivibrio sp. AE3004]
MRKNIARKLAMLLALVVLVTTFGSDYNSIGARATSEEQVTSTNHENYESLFTEGIGEEQNNEQVAEETADEPAKEEVVQEEHAQVETVQEESATEQVSEEPQTEAATEDPAQEETTQVEPAAEEQTQETAPAEEVTPNEEQPAEDPSQVEPAQEEPAQETPAEEKTEEEVPAEVPAKEVVEIKEVTVTYTATKGGTVSNTSETIDVNAEGAAFEGSTAIAWNDKYEFVNWTDANDNEVSTEATFVPSNIEENATFKANFKAAEGIEVDMPELSAEDVHEGGMVVSVKAEEGIFPAGTEISITAISDDQALETAQNELGDQVTTAKGVDITFMFEGKEIQPADRKYVHVSLALEEALTEENVTVLHDHDGEVETIEADVTENANGDVEAVEFDSNEFSIYIVAGGTEEENRLHVSFYNENAKTSDNKDGLIADLYIKENDIKKKDASGNKVIRDDALNNLKSIIYDPGVGTINEQDIFKGWTQDQNYTKDSKAYSIDDIRTMVAGTAVTGLQVDGNNVDGMLPPSADGVELKFYAMFFNQYRVNYVDNNGISLGEHFVDKLSNASGEAAIQEYKVNMAYTPEDDEHDFQGWIITSGADKIVKVQQKDEEGNPKKDAEGNPIWQDANYTKGDIIQNDTLLKICGDITFSVNAPKGYWIVFEQNGKGATYIAPKFIMENERAFKPPVQDKDGKPLIVRKGYTFDNWYEVEGFDDKGNPLKDDKGNIRLKSEPFWKTEAELKDGKVLNSKTFVAAKWISNETASYTILIYKKTLNDNTKSNGESESNDEEEKGLQFVASYVGTGKVNDSIKKTAIKKKKKNDLFYVDLGTDDYDTKEQYGGIAKPKTESDPYHLMGYTYNEELTEDGTITTEGDGVAKIVFEPMEYNFRFYVSKDDGNGLKGSSKQGPEANYDGNWDVELKRQTKINGSEPTLKEGDYYYFNLTAKYGERLLDASNNERWYSYSNIDSKPAFVSWILMRDAKAHTGDDKGKDTIKGTVSFMDEQVLGDLSKRDGNFVTARYEDGVYKWKYRLFFQNEDGTYPDDPGEVVEAKSAQNIKDSQHNPGREGYELDEAKTLYHQKKDADGYYIVDFYYSPLYYKINFMDGEYVDGDGNQKQNRAAHLLKTVDDVKYQSKIAGNYYKPSLPEGQEGYVFEGWYKDKKCTHPYEHTIEKTIEGNVVSEKRLGEKEEDVMPKGGITVYAKWRIIQYRVFLHPNAGTKETVPDLSWGDENAQTKQAMNFRVSYGDKISTPYGTRSGYEFVGWFIDPGLKHAFNGSAIVMNETNVTTPYNKGTDKTDPMDKWGNGANTNNDESRWWIEKKYDIYAKWRKVIDGADGIKVVYSPDDPDVDDDEKIEVPKDGKLYVDNADAYAVPASKAPKGYEFGYWVMQKWNGSAYEDVKDEYGNIKPILPGTTYVVLVDNAKQELDKEHTTEEKTRYTYTIQLRAEYVKLGDPTPTYIPWFENDGTEAFQIDIVKKVGEEYKYTLGINEAVDIQKKPTDAKDKEDYEFVGWARVKMGESEAEAKAFMANSSNWTQNIANNDPEFIYYKENDEGVGKFYSDKACTKEAKQVAADEDMPYQAMFAVWKKKTVDVVVKYYKDNPSDSNYLGDQYDDTTTFKNVEVGTKIELNIADNEAVLNKCKSVVGINYGDGAQSPSSHTVVATPNPNVIKVVYVRKLVDYTIRYWKGKSITDTNKQRILPDAVSSGNAAGTEITLTDSQINDKDHKPEKGYKNGIAYKDNTVLEGNKFTLDADSNNNIIDVLYTPNKITVTIVGKTATTMYTGEEQSTYKLPADDTDFKDEGTTEEYLGYMITGITAEEGTAPSKTDLKVKLKKDVKAEARGTEVKYNNEYYPMNLQGGTKDNNNCSFTWDNTTYQDVEFDVTDGWLKITPNEEKLVVKIVGKTVETPYTGEKQSTKTFKKDGFDPIEKGYRIDSIKYDNEGQTDVDAVMAEEIAAGVALANGAKDYAEGTDVNTTDNPKYLMGMQGGTNGDADCSFVYTDINNTNHYKGSIRFVVEDGWLKINPVKDEIVVTITGNHAITNYNGKEQSVKGYKVDSITKKNGEKFTGITADDIALVSDGNAVASGKDVKRNAVTKAIESYVMGLRGSEAGSDCSFKCTNPGYTNVVFVVHDGYLTINPLKLTVEVIGNRGEEFYDGTEKRVEGYTLNNVQAVSDGNAVSNGNAVTDGSAAVDPTSLFDKSKVTFTGEAVAKGILPDTYPMGLTPGQFGYDDPNIDVTFTVIDGQLIIKDIPEGKKLHVMASTPDVVEMYSGKTWLGSDFDYTVEGSAPSTNAAIKTLGAIGDFVNKVLGIFKVHAAETGKPIEINGVKYFVSGLRVEVKARSVGKYDLAIVDEGFKVTDVNGNDVTKQFDDPTYKIGTLTIIPKPIEITSGTAEKVYDKTPLVCHVATENTTWGEGDAVTYEFTGSQTEPGTSKNTFTAKPANDLTDFKNYEIKYILGDLTVKKPTDVEPPKDPEDPKDPPKDPEDPKDPPKENPKKHKKHNPPVDNHDDDDHYRGGNDNSNNNPPAKHGDVLGAKRSDGGEKETVLGARRGGTDDYTNTSRIIVLLIAAGAVVTLLATGKKRKKNDE